MVSRARTPGHVGGRQHQQQFLFTESGPGQTYDGSQSRPVCPHAGQQHASEAQPDSVRGNTPAQRDITNKTPEEPSDAA
jgi:hypothetical protein